MTDEELREELSASFDKHTIWDKKGEIVGYDIEKGFFKDVVQIVQSQRKATIQDTLTYLQTAYSPGALRDVVDVVKVADVLDWQKREGLR